jgi:hypothetical protein
MTHAEEYTQSLIDAGAKVKAHEESLKGKPEAKPFKEVKTVKVTKATAVKKGK